MTEQPEHLRNAVRGKPKGYKSAVEAMCKHCIYDPGSGDGTWRQQVGACTATTCPLFHVRPLPQGEKHG